MDKGNLLARLELVESISDMFQLGFLTLLYYLDYYPAFLIVLLFWIILPIFTGGGSRWSIVKRLREDVLKDLG